MFKLIRKISYPVTVSTKSGEFTFGINEYKDEGIIAYIEGKNHITFIPLKDLMYYIAGTAADQIIELQKHGIAEKISFYHD